MITHEPKNVAYHALEAELNAATSAVRAKFAATRTGDYMTKDDRQRYIDQVEQACADEVAKRIDALADAWDEMRVEDEALIAAQPGDLILAWMFEPDAENPWRRGPAHTYGRSK